jgi:hypothetical protein
MAVPKWGWISLGRDLDNGHETKIYTAVPFPENGIPRFLVGSGGGFPEEKGACAAMREVCEWWFEFQRPGIDIMYSGVLLQQQLLLLLLLLLLTTWTFLLYRRLTSLGTFSISIPIRRRVPSSDAALFLHVSSCPNGLGPHRGARADRDISGGLGASIRLDAQGGNKENQH